MSAESNPRDRSVAPSQPSPCPSPPVQGQGIPPNPRPSDHESQQPTAEQLAQLGIQVRDFAYESTLPPIAPVYFLPKQIQPDPRMTRMGPSQGLPLHLQLLPRPALVSTDVPRKLEKKPTEPTIWPSFGVTRERGFSDLRDYDALYNSPSFHSQFQPPLLHSQNYDEYIKTPVVTPNGSLQWQEDVGLDEPSTSRVDTSIPIRPLSYPQREEPPKNELLFTSPSPLSSAHSSFSMSPSPIPGSKPMLPKRRARRGPSRPTRAQKSHRGKDLVPQTASRYYLRKRPSRTSSISKPITRSCPGPSPLSKSRPSVAPPSHPQEERSEGPPLRSFRKRPTSSLGTKGRKRS